MRYLTVTAMIPTDKEFIFQLTSWQSRLYGYLVTLLGSVHDAHDVLQETNLVLWQKIHEFEQGSDFGAWARRCAYFQARAFLRDKKRDRHIFDADLLDVLAEEPPDHAAPEDRELALRDCLSRLPEKQTELIQQRYMQGSSIAQMASRFGKKESALKMTLMRTREALLVCIESKLQERLSS
ncbi:MAG: sigma-70 family RNA polymerase sigma factor [Verrucomicrobiota bacterium]